MKKLCEHPLKKWNLLTFFLLEYAVDKVWQALHRVFKEDQAVDEVRCAL